MVSRAGAADTRKSSGEEFVWEPAMAEEGRGLGSVSTSCRPAGLTWGQRVGAPGVTGVTRLRAAARHYWPPWSKVGHCPSH